MNKTYNMKKTIRLTESDLIRIVKRVINEEESQVTWNDFKSRVQQGISSYTYWKLFPKNWGDQNEITTYTYPQMTYKGYKFDGAYPEGDNENGIETLSAYATQVKGDTITFKTRLGNDEYTFKIKKP